MHGAGALNPMAPHRTCVSGRDMTTRRYAMRWACEWAVRAWLDCVDVYAGCMSCRSPTSFTGWGSRARAWVPLDFCGDDHTHFFHPFSALRCVTVTKEGAAHRCSLCTDDVLTGSCSEMVMGCFSFHGSLHSHHALIDTHAHPAVCVINKLNILLLSYLICSLQCHATAASATPVLYSWSPPSYYRHI